MSPAIGPASPSDRIPAMMPAVMSSQQQQAAVPPVVSSMAAHESATKDAVIGWYKGEFAAANAIIDALCNHLTMLNSFEGVNGSSSEYESVFGAIHCRRLNWIPVIQRQKYYSIGDVAMELRKVVEARKAKDGYAGRVNGNGGEVVAENVGKEEEKENPTVAVTEVVKCEKKEIVKEDAVDCNENGGHDMAAMADEDSPDSEVTDVGSHEVHATVADLGICDNHDDCCARRERIKITKGFVAKEPVKGHMVNVVKGLKIYEDAFTDSELSKLNQFVDEIRVAGQNGQLLGDTYILFNQMTKDNKREQIQLGLPIFRHIKDESNDEQHKDDIEPIPTILHSVIDHLVEWHILPENRKPDGCLINFFDEGEHSQPYLKPPHLDQPLCTVLLSDSTLAFGRTLGSDNDGNYKGPLMLTVKEGSVLIMRNNSSDLARHAMCPSPTKRVTLTFFRIRPENHHKRPKLGAPLTEAMTLWQPGVPPCTIPDGAPNGHRDIDLVPNWGIIHPPLVMLAPMRPVVMNCQRMPLNSGTGVFLPWKVGARKPAKQLPPRAQRERRLALPSADRHISDTMSDPGVEVPVM